MKICIICVEIFAWGKYGGFGRSARMLGRELVRRGLEVSAVVPRRNGQRSVETLDGMTVYSYPMQWPFAMSGLFRRIDADICHSQQQSLGTALALRAMPDRKHLVTFRDPKDRSDWLLEFRNPSRSKVRVAMNWLFEDGPGIRRAVRRADGRFTAAPGLNRRLQRIYGLSAPLETLPTPVEIPGQVAKSPTPLVSCIGRLDRRKRPELFFRLAREFPQVRFVAAGQGQDRAWERSLRETYGDLPNLELRGFIDQFESDSLSELLSKSWILANTAVREGVPTSSLEAMAHQCAVLSHVNPDNMARRFGYHVAGDDFAEGLAWLLEHDRWREKGLEAQRYVQRHFECAFAIDKHLEVYERVMSAGRRGGTDGD